MKILVDIGHPAHVHYFRNLIKQLETEGYTFLVLARDKEVTHSLLDAYDIPFVDKGKGGKAFFDRIDYTIRSLFLINQHVRSFKPDLCLSFYSPYLSVVSSMQSIPHIMFNDTESQLMITWISRIFNSEIHSPDSYINPDLRFQKLFKSYMELAYLHPDIYSPDSSIKNITGDDYILLRFVSNQASHDLGYPGIDHEEKVRMFRFLSEFKKVWISSEVELPEELVEHQLSFPPNSMHDLIANASLLIGGSATMSSEAAMLGVPSIHINHNEWGYIKELDEKYNLVHHFKTDKKGIDGALNKSKMILENKNYSSIYRKRSKGMLSEKINLNDYMISIIKEKESN